MNRRLVLFLAAVLAIKLIVVWQLKDHILLQPDAGLDTSVYLSLASRVAAGDLWLGPGLYFISPLYIYFVAAILAVTSSVTAIRIAQVLLGTCSVGLVWWMTRQWLSVCAAWIAAVLAAATGLFTFYETLLLQSGVDVFLTTSALALLTAALNLSARRWFFLTGVAFGMQALNRPNVLMAAIGLVVLLLLRRGYRDGFLMTAGILVALAPITLRNVAVTGEWTPVSSHGGLNFYIGNNAEADGTYHAVPGITPSIVGQQEDSRRVAERAVGRRLDDAEVSSFFYDLAISWIRSEPAEAARLFGRKLYYVFNASHLPLNFSYPFYARDAGTLLLVLGVGPWLLVPLGTIGLAWSVWQRRNAALAIWAAFVPLYALSVAIFFVAERYRLPLMVPLCVGAAATLDTGGSYLRARQVGRLAILLAVCGVIGVAANWHLGLDNGRAEERTRMAERLVALGRFDEAKTWTAQAERIHPTPGVMHFRLGRAYLAANRTDEALEHLERSEAIDPGQPEIDFVLGEALLQAGRVADAVPRLRRAFDRGVRTDLSGFDLARALAATGDRAGAVAVLQHVRPARSDDADSWFALGELALKLQAAPVAQAFFFEAAKARPTFAAAHQQLGLAYGVSGRSSEAAGELEQAVRLEPGDPAAHLNLAVVYAQLGRTDAARRHASEALRLRPGYDKASRLLATLK